MKPLLFFRSMAGPLMILFAGLTTLACTPRVEVVMPSEPIHIKLDIKIEHEIRVKVDRELDNLFSPESGLF
ncbi:MAG: hypothetical protein DDT25_00751 [Chloroflexi bacterium]|nr:hypothetical protein [Chloroflexota bacterium]